MGEPLTDPVVVEVTDSRGRPVEGATVAFEFGSAGAGAAVVPLEKTTDGNGLAEAQLVLGTSIGRQAGQARVVLEGGGEPLQATFSATARPENANGMAAVSGQDQTGHVGLPLTDRLVVEVTDGFGNPVPRVAISWTAVGGGSVSEAVVETDEDGRSRVDRILGPTVGQQTTVASSEGLVGSPVTFVHTALAGDASRLVIISGNDQTAEVGSMLPAELVVQLIDADGNGVPQTAVSWVVAIGGGAATPENSTTDGDGRTSARWTLGGTLGQQRLDAVVPGLGIASFQATATAVAPPSLFIRTQPSPSARNGVPLTTQPVVQLRDSRGNDLAQAGVLVTAAIGSGGGELGGTRQVSTDGSGQATFTNLSISGGPGPRTLIFTAAGYAQATSGEIVVAAIATTTTIIADSPDPSAAGSTFPVQIRVASDGPVPTGTVAVSVSGGTPTCTATLSGGVGSCPLTLNLVGDWTLTAVYSGAPGLLGSSDTEGHRVQATEPPPPAGTVTTITGDSPDPTVSGSTFTVSFRVTSSGGTPTGSVTVSVSGGTPTCTGNLSGGSGSCQLTLNIVGDRTLTATYSGAPGFSSSSDTEGHRVEATEPPPPASTVTTITGDSPDPTVSGSTFTVSFQVTSGGGTPTGSVTVSVSGGTPTCTGNLSGGSGSCQLTLNTVGDRTLTATYSGASGFSSSSDTEPHTVNPVPPSNEPPDADFRWRCEDLTCHFTDASEDPDGNETIMSRSWNFGDGTAASNELNPSHTYATAGDYRVVLTVTDDGGLSDDASDTVDPEAPPPPNQPPTAAFTWRCDDLECEFENGSSDSDGRIEDHAWTFGDGGTSDDDDPDHRYSAGGTYQVTLTVTDDDEATGSVTHSVTVTEPPPPNQEPTAAFTESCADLACSFNSGGSSDPDGTIVIRSWNFGDGNTSSEPNPNHTYAESGTYSVTLRVEDDDGATDDETHQVTVTLPPPPNEPPTAAFSAPGCTTNEPCQFTDGSSDSDGTIEGWAWNFGDGTAIDPSQHPTHVFTLAGSYTVTLTVTDDDGDTGETSQSVTVTDPPPPAP